MIVFSWLLVITGLVGFGAAAYWDLKTTEFPEWLPYGMIVIALIIHCIASFVLSDIWIFLSSLIVGLILLGFGLLLYFTKQWGDGDAWLLGAMGFLFPIGSWFLKINPQINITVLPFPVVMLMNFFIIAFAYLIIYSIALGFRSQKESKKFLKTLKGKSRNLLLIFILLTILIEIFVYFISYTLMLPLTNLMPIMFMPIIIMLLFIFLQYGRFVEKNLFKKTIDTKNLRVGDVPVGARWRGLTEKEVRDLKKRGGKIQIKEGIRFAPVFIINLIITIIFGNLLLLFL